MNGPCADAAPRGGAGPGTRPARARHHSGASLSSRAVDELGRDQSELADRAEELIDDLRKRSEALAEIDRNESAALEETAEVVWRCPSCERGTDEEGPVYTRRKGLKPQEF